MIKKLFALASSLSLLLITASYIHGAAVDLAWDPPEDGGECIGYIVYGSTTSGDYSDPIAVEIVEETYATVSALDNTQTYYFVVKAYNCAGIGEPSNEICVAANSDDFYDDGSGDVTSDESKGSGGGGGGCFIATAAYGSPFEKHVEILRQFRDFYLMPTTLGRGFVELYYEYSPGLADVIARHDALKIMTRWGLAPVVGMAYVTLYASASQKIGIMIFILMLIAGCCVARRFTVQGSRFTVK